MNNTPKPAAVITPHAIAMRDWIKKILGAGVSYGDGLRRKKHPNGGVNYCWVIDDIKPDVLENITELAALSKHEPNVTLKVVAIATGCAPGKAWRGGVYVRCKVYA